MPISTLLAMLMAGTSSNLVSNGNFDAGPSEWNLIGNAIIDNNGYEGTSGLTLVPAEGSTAQATRTITGLLPRSRYTVSAKVRTDNRLCPPILGIRNGAQIEKASGYTAIEEQGRWTEERFEFFTGDATSIDLVLQAWQSSEQAIVQFDEIQLELGRQDPPVPEQWQGTFSKPPRITIQPSEGDRLILDGSFDDAAGGSWAPGIEAEVVETELGNAMRLLSTADTSRARQPIDLALAPGSSYEITAMARVDPGVVGTIYLVGSGDLLCTTSITSTSWAPVTLQFETGDDWVINPKITLENWKNQPGSAWFTDIEMLATGSEWAATTHAVPQSADGFVETFDEGFLDPDRWLISTKSWGGDNGGVSPLNCSLVRDTDNGEPIIALKLQANGDLYDGPIEHEGRRTRVGSAIATRQYYASGRYEVRAKIAPDLGVVTAFWPFHYIDYYPSQDGHWHEPNPRRNTEIDWEFPTDLRGNEAEAEAAGIDPDRIAFTNARTNSWGGQFGGEGGEHKGRHLLRTAEGDVVDLAEDSIAGIYHTYAIEWHSGSDLGDNGDTRDEPGCVRWYFDDVLIDELYDVEFGQGNVPFRAARFWLGAWFAASGYIDEIGWGGSPNFETSDLLIASISITPFNDSRDAYEPETVPNLAWAPPGEYPDPVEIDPTCPGDIDGDARVGIEDLLVVLGAWGGAGPAGDTDGNGTVGVEDLLIVIGAWGTCEEG